MPHGADAARRSGGGTAAGTAGAVVVQMVTVHRVPVADHDLSAATRQVLVAPSVSWTLPVQTYPNPLRWRYRARAGVARRAGSPGERRLHTSHGVGTPRVQGRRSSSANSKVATPIRPHRPPDESASARPAGDGPMSLKVPGPAPLTAPMSRSRATRRASPARSQTATASSPSLAQERASWARPRSVCAPPRSPGRLPERADRVL